MTRFFCTAILIFLPCTLEAQLRFYWEGEFTDMERTKLTTWIEGTSSALESLVGKLPFDVHVHLHRASSSRGPVPWGQTRRGSRQGILLYVDPTYSLEELKADWTAPHELSHLVIPYFGNRYSWFAEGFASFMQYEVMKAEGVLSDADAEQRFRERVDRAERRYRWHDMPFAEAAPHIRAARQYPTMYWGGALYFRRIDETLAAERDLNLLGVLTSYVSCCRMKRTSMDGLLTQLDEISGTDLFSETMREFKTREGFPEKSL